MERGFEKFFAMGMMDGAALIWKLRISPPERGLTRLIKTPSALMQAPETSLPSLPGLERLEKHVRVLQGLVEPESISTKNSEEEVSEFEDRLRRATAKARIIEKIIGEQSSISGQSNSMEPPHRSRVDGELSIEDATAMIAPKTRP